MSIKTDAIVIRDETVTGANTALRVGTNLEAIADDLIAKQAEIDLNNVKETNIAHPLVETAVPVGAVFTDTDTIYDDTAIQAEVDLNTLKETNIAHPLVETAVPLGAVFTDTVYDDTAIQAEVDLNTAKTSYTYAELGVFSTPITLDVLGGYTKVSQAGAINFTFGADANHVEGIYKILHLVGDGTNPVNIIRNDTDINYNGFTDGFIPVTDGLHRFVFSYLNGEIDIDYSLKNILTIDITPPTFSVAPASASILETSFNITAQLNEDGTIYAVVVADGASAPTSAEVKAGTGSGGSGQLAIGNASDTGTGVTIPLTGLTQNTAYDVYVVGEDLTTNLQASPTLVNVTTEATVTSIIEFEDDFAGTVIDPSWTLTQLDANIVVSQDEDLRFTMAVTGTSSWGSCILWQSIPNNTDWAVQIEGTQITTATPTINRGLIVRSPTGLTASRIRATSIGDIDFNFVDSAGTEVIAVTVSATAFEGNTWRIMRKSNTVTISYWGGASWTVLGTGTAGTNTDTDIVAELRSGSIAQVGDVRMDNFYITNDSYTTQFPV